MLKRNWIVLKRKMNGTLKNAAGENSLHQLLHIFLQSFIAYCVNGWCHLTLLGGIHCFCCKFDDTVARNEINQVVNGTSTS